MCFEFFSKKPGMCKKMKAFMKIELESEELKGRRRMTGGGFSHVNLGLWPGFAVVP